MQVYLFDAQGIFAGVASVDPMQALPPCAMTPPPETTGDEVAQWAGNGWVVLPERPEPDLTLIWAAIRAERNAKLAASDWTQLPDAPVDAAAWATYRQALRDITTQSDPFNVTWPQEAGE